LFCSGSVSLEEIESNLGLKFHSKLDRTLTGDLCEVDDGCQMMDYRQFQSFFVKRGINGARSMGELKRYWKKALVSQLIVQTDNLSTVVCLLHT
jgi:hypothetical protein